MDTDKPVCRVDAQEDPIQGSYRNALPEKYANTYPYHAATHRHESDGWRLVVPFVVPVDHVITGNRTLAKVATEIHEEFPTELASVVEAADDEYGSLLVHMTPKEAALWKTLFDQENRILVLEGKATLTKTQFETDIVKPNYIWAKANAG